MDGSGSAPNRVPTFAASLGHFVRNDLGRAFLIQVSGVAQSTLGDAEIADLLNWLLPTYGTPELPSNFRPYTAIEVQAERNHRPADLMATRALVAQQLQALGFFITHY